MALVVPIRPDQPATPHGPMSATAPPDENFLLMSAALMHRDGRLIKTAQNDKPSIGERVLQKAKEGVKVMTGEDVDNFMDRSMRQLHGMPPPPIPELKD